jgi:hypothetical protein
LAIKYETITKIANTVQQFPAEIIQKTKHLGVFRSDNNGWRFFCKKKWLGLIFSCILLISSSMLSRAN